MMFEAPAPDTALRQFAWQWTMRGVGIGIVVVLPITWLVFNFLCALTRPLGLLTMVVTLIAGGAIGAMFGGSVFGTSAFLVRAWMGRSNSLWIYALAGLLTVSLVFAACFGLLQWADES